MQSYAEDQMTAGRGQDLLVAGLTADLTVCLTAGLIEDLIEGLIAGLTVGLIEELIEGLIAGLIAGMIVDKTAGEGLLTSDEREDLLIGENKRSFKLTK